MNLDHFCLSLILPTHQNPQGLLALIKSIEECKIPFTYEIVVVTNLPDHDLELSIGSKEDCCLAVAGSVGVNKARNLGLKIAKYDYVYFFDDDCLIEDLNFFSKLRDRALTLKGKNQFIGGYYGIQYKASLVARSYIEIQNQWLRRGRVNAKNSAYLIGGNCGGSRQSFMDLLFDEEIAFGGSETEFFLRALSKGGEMFLFEDLIIIHNTSLNFSQLIKKAMRQSAGLVYLERKGLSYKPCYYSIAGAQRPSASVQFIKNVYLLFFRFNYALKKKIFISTYCTQPLKRLRRSVVIIWKNFFMRMSSLLELILWKNDK